MVIPGAQAGHGGGEVGVPGEDVGKISHHRNLIQKDSAGGTRNVGYNPGDSGELGGVFKHEGDLWVLGGVLGKLQGRWGWGGTEAGGSEPRWEPTVISPVDGEA